MMVDFLRSANTLLTLAAIVFLSAGSPAQAPQKQPTANGGQSSHASDESASRELPQDSTQAREDLQRGTALTREGRFQEAIPHLLAAQGRVANDYAVSFNLALCYVGINDYKKAIPILEQLRRQGRENADVENLLAQAYVGNGEGEEALSAVQRAAAISPENEKLFIFVADACTQAQNFDLGLKIVEIGLRHLPQSAKLHYQRALFLAELDQLDHAKSDFDLASRLGQGREIGYLSAAHKNLLEGNLADTIRVAHQSIGQGFQSPAMLTILGEALLRSGITPGQPEFREAQAALEKSIAEQPGDASSQIALGQIDLLAGHLDDSIAHLQSARKLRPNQPAIYASLARAYQRKGDTQHAQESLARLESLNQKQAEKIRSAPGERKMSYGGMRSSSPD